MLSFLYPRHHQQFDEDYESPPGTPTSTTGSTTGSTFSTFIKRGQLPRRKKSSASSSSSSSEGEQPRYQSPRRRVTFSRVVIVNDPTTFLIVKEDHANPNSLGRRPSKQRIDQWLHRSASV